MDIEGRPRIDLVTAPTGELWSRVAELYIEVFSAPPYAEDPCELAEILEWGPEILRDHGGRLVIARDGDDIVGFALGQPLLSASDWQGLLVRCGSPEAEAMRAAPEQTFIVREIATSARARGRGIGTECLARLTQGAGAPITALGVYAHAEEARNFYRRLAFDHIGSLITGQGQELLILAR
jgi:GNAT superfamily N-acetyltransferase